MPLPIDLKYTVLSTSQQLARMARSPLVGRGRSKLLLAGNVGSSASSLNGHKSRVRAVGI